MESLLRIILFSLLCICLLGTSNAAACTNGTVPWPLQNGKFNCQPVKDAVVEATAFLRANLPSFDKINEETLFGAPGGVDGLDVGIATVSVNMSLDAKMEFPWAAQIPQDIFFNYVLAYVQLNFLALPLVAYCLLFHVESFVF